MLPRPPNPLLTKEAAPVEGLTGMLELTNSVPHVKSIMAAAVVYTLETGCERFVAALAKTDMVFRKQLEQLGDVVPGKETPKGK
jgi:hypothetical protein